VLLLIVFQLKPTFILKPHSKKRPPFFSGTQSYLHSGTQSFQGSIPRYRTMVGRIAVLTIILFVSAVLSVLVNFLGRDFLFTTVTCVKQQHGVEDSASSKPEDLLQDDEKNGPPSTPLGLTTASTQDASQRGNTWDRLCKPGALDHELETHAFTARGMAAHLSANHWGPFDLTTAWVWHAA
jgi:hypothetical protein